ncbi:hypothetical protein HO133_000978 [Letharia lupina]|uniref:RRM domain-containing protein n=1 Tax=Letharia lupina TaxID=560253 RepID=A0A8H6CGA2_9LECA|nr:uncharacterized protein HO133_000978 [Letharia lupina]KAF6222927.1 hypothetical protein HO133_000978 [Letharia lupina]
MGSDLKRKEARKRKFEGQHSESLLDAGVKSGLEGTLAGGPLHKKSNQAPPPPSSSERIPTAEKIAARKVAVVDESTDQGKEEESAIQKAQRFIVFIGNLPYTATDESVSKHFAKINPKSIRHRKEKDTEKSKGFAFLEFEGYDRMKTCLKLYHQSDFEDGESPARKLNVELTAGGGGGKSKDRKSKLRAKNERLNEQRKRRNQEEEKRRKIPQKDSQPTHALGNNGDIHPSRRSRVATDSLNL